MMLIALLAALQGQLPPSLTAPPQTREVDPYLLCRCDDETEADVTTITGIVRDAELRLAPDGLSVLPEQVTIFSVIKSSDPSIGKEVRIHHKTRPKDCGLSFDYGKRYDIRATRKDSVLETNWCLDPRRGDAR